MIHDVWEVWAVDCWSDDTWGEATASLIPIVAAIVANKAVSALVTQ